MVVPLREATADTCGGKAAVLATLLREGLPVPDGFVVPFVAQESADGAPPISAALRSAVAERLAAMGDSVVVAVRSSAANEDTTDASGAGQYESVIGVQGTDAVSEAIRTCWASARSDRVSDYWRGVHGARQPGPPDMAVLVQRLVDADVSGVMFTPSAPGHGTRIEASRGLGLDVVGGAVTPDSYEIAPDGGVNIHDVPSPERTRPVLEDEAATALAVLGERVAAILGRPQDIEWAVADGKAWILQSRPVTAPLPPLPARPPSSDGAVLTGIPGAHGIAGGIARVLHSPAELARVRRGNIVVCRFTEPAWTPAFGIAGGVVTETGGVLSHAAIVAREHGIPAVLGVAHATTSVRDGARITVDGTAGTVTVTPD
ncbi:PEP/pyruvate-binding domain-containing protein [Myceligenerans halotolerans]